MPQSWLKYQLQKTTSGHTWRKQECPECGEDNWKSREWPGREKQEQPHAQDPLWKWKQNERPEHFHTSSFHRRMVQQPLSQRTVQQYRYASSHCVLHANKPIRSWKYHQSKIHLIHLNYKHHSLASPALNMIQNMSSSLQLGKIIQHKAYFTMKSHNLLNTVLRVKNRTVVWST